MAAAGWAPSGWTPEFFHGLGLEDMPGSGVNAATVPGAVAGYDAMLERFGTMTFRETFERAATLAEEGCEQRALPCSIGSNEADHVSATNHRGEIVQQHAILHDNPEAIGDQRLISAPGANVEADGHRALVLWRRTQPR